MMTPPSSAKASAPSAVKLSSKAMSQLTHIDEQGRAKMVDTSDKSVTARRAVGLARVLASPATIEAIRKHQTPKGDPLETARLAGVMAAKQTADLIPLCHPLPLTHVDVRAEVLRRLNLSGGGSRNARANRRRDGSPDRGFGRRADHL